MLARPLAAAVLSVFFVLLALSCNDGAKARQTCEKAADKYSACMKKILGPEAGKMADGKRDIESCAKDERTVKMYERCNPKEDCKDFMDCMEDEAKKGP